MSRARFGPATTVLALLCVMYALTYIDRVNVSTAASIFRAELGLSNTQIGLVFSAFAYPYLVFQIIGGWVGDRFGARFALTSAAVIWAAATGLTGLAGGFTTLMLARLLLGFGEGATFPVATRAMADWTPPAERAFAQGLAHSCARLGNALTPPLVAWLTLAVSWRGSFLVLGLGSAAWALVWRRVFRDDPRDHPRMKPEDLARLTPRPATRRTEPVPWRALAWRILPVTIVYFCYGWTLWLYLAWIPSFFFQSYKLKLSDSALFASGVFLAGVLGDTLGGVLSDRLLRRTGDRNVARRNLVVASLLCSLVTMAPILVIHDVTWAAICLSAAFFFAELTIGPMWAIPMDIAPRYAGSASGLMNTGSALAAIVSPLAAGYVIDRTNNWNLPFVGSMGLLFAGAILAFAMKPNEELVIPAA